MMIDGNTQILAHIGYPTTTFRAPLIYNPWFDAQGINAKVVPMGCKSEAYPRFLRSVFTLENIRGALITMPHKVVTVGLLDDLRPAAAIAGAVNAVRKLPDGRLQGDMFDGEGFVRGIRAKGFEPQGRRALVLGAGGVGSAIAASLAAAGLRELRLHDPKTGAAQTLASRLRQHHPQLDVRIGGSDPADCELVVNASPLGMNDADPLPTDPSRIDPGAFVGEVILKTDMTPLLRAAQARGCTVQIGADMLYEMIPAYLEFFGFPAPSAQALRETAQAAQAAEGRVF